MLLRRASDDDKKKISQGDIEGLFKVIDIFLQIDICVLWCEVVVGIKTY